MKKKTVYLLFIFLLFTGKTFAQVGIGTATPNNSAMLDVSSTTKGFLAPRLTTSQRLTLSATAAEGLMVYDTDTHSYWFFKSGAWTNIAAGSSLPSGTAGNTLRNDGSSWISNSFLFNSGTRIGVGTTNPSAAFEIIGTDIAYGLPSGPTNALDAFYVKGGRGGSLQMQGGQGGNGGELTVFGGSGAGGSIHGGSGGGLLLKGGNGGNGGGGVGGNGGDIQLQAGNGGSAGSYGGNILLLPGTGETVPGRVGIGTSYPMDLLHLNGAMYLEPVTVPDNTSNRIYNLGGSLYFGDLNLSGSLTLAGVYGNAGNEVHMSTAGGNLHFYNDDPDFPDLFYLDQVTGFAGLGTSSPEARLDIRHGIPMEFGDVKGLNISVYGGDKADGLIVSNGAGGAGGLGWAGSFSSSAGNGGGALKINNEGGVNSTALKVTHGGITDLIVNGTGQVGIGVSSPSHFLHIGGETYFDFGDAGTWIKDAGTGKANIGDITYYDENLYRLGVRTINPSATFHVNGSVRFENLTGTGNMLGIDGSGNISRTNAADSRIGSQTLNYVPRWNGSALVSGSLFDNGSGVGIGTSSPVGKFGVRASNKQLNIGLYYGGGSMGIYTDDGVVEIGDGAGVDGGLKIIDNGGGTDIYLNSAGNSYLNQYSGNVGIGISTPGSKLHVEANSATYASQINNSSMSGKGLFVNGYNSGIETYSAGPGIKATSYQNYGADIGGYQRAVYAHTSSLTAFSIYAEGTKNYFEGNVGIGTNAPASKLEVRSTSTTAPAVKIEQNFNIQPFIQYQGTVSGDPNAGNLTTYNETDVMQGPGYNNATYVGWYFAGMVKVRVNDGEYWMPYYAYNACGKSKASCPRIDAWIDGRWVNVGRAIEHQNSKEKDGRHDIRLNVPAQKFRLVEDETEISHVHAILGDGENWGLGEITTTPSEAYGIDGFTVEFSFSKPVILLETYGYYEFIFPQKK